MAEDTEKVISKQVAGQAESGYPKIIAVDDDGIPIVKGDG